MSGASAINYLIYLKDHLAETKTEGVLVLYTIILLFVFAVLCFMGLKESAAVALFIFLLHVGTLLYLLVICFMHAFHDNWNILYRNWQIEPEPVKIGGKLYTNILAFLFMGFSNAILVRNINVY